MSFGEITITLNDVPILVGISVIGRSVNTPKRITDVEEMFVSLLGVSPQDSHYELDMIWDTLSKIGIPPFQVL